MGTAKFKIVNAPENCNVLINGLELSKDSEGWYKVPHGPLLVEIKRDDSLLFSALYSLDSAEEKVITFNCKEKCASFTLKTEPLGALFSMNGEIMGTTPYTSSLFAPDTYSLMITLPAHVPIIKRIILKVDSPTVLNYNLELTPAAKDSLLAAKEALKKKRRIITSSLFGGIAIISGTIGAYFDFKASEYLRKSTKESEAYDNAKSEIECNIHKELYFINKRESEKNVKNRNIFYFISGTFITGFYISMFF
ncbi:MAG: PEGA domain-containing protein [Chitinispirillaceae bacterium]|nr:PEGA domain-containing protein [Chitinispirillaceae bacterium]